MTGKPFSNTKDILEKEISRITVYRIWRKLFSNNAYVSNSNIKRPSGASRGYCEEEISIDDFLKALKYLAKNKSPGIDGFTAEFYKIFWINIKKC